MPAPKPLESLRAVRCVCRLLLVTGVAACAEVDLTPVALDQDGPKDGPGAVVGAGDADAGTLPERPQNRVDGGCSGAPPTNDSATSESGDASPGADGECASDHLVMHHSFEQSLRDATAYGNDATNVGNVGYEPGVVGDALVLGPDSVADVPRSESLEFGGPLTVELWVRPSALPPGGGRAGLLDDDGRYGLFLTSLGEVLCVGGGASVTGGELAVGTWAHVACVLVDSTLTLWQDGQERGRVENAEALKAPGTHALAIGGNAPTGDRFAGLLDDLRIWREARSASQLGGAAPAR